MCSLAENARAEWIPPRKKTATIAAKRRDRHNRHAVTEGIT